MSSRGKMSFDEAPVPISLSVSKYWRRSVLLSRVFATSKIFEDIYVNEIAYWDEGMPFELFNSILQDKGYRPLPAIKKPKETVRIVSSDIPVIGARGLKVLDHVGVYLDGFFEGCIGCKKCEKECPERALRVMDLGNKKFQVRVETEHCLGTACKNCESVCPQKCYIFNQLKIVNRS